MENDDLITLLVVGAIVVVAWHFRTALTRTADNLVGNTAPKAPLPPVRNTSGTAGWQTAVTLGCIGGAAATGVGVGVGVPVCALVGPYATPIVKGLVETAEHPTRFIAPIKGAVTGAYDIGKSVLGHLNPF